MVEKANKILVKLRSTFESRVPKMWKDEYVSLVRLHLEYAVQAWNPHLQADNDKIDTIQRKATRTPTGCGNLSMRRYLKD